MSNWQKSLTVWKTKPFIKAIKTKHSQAEIFLVGGPVRDALIGRETTDFDFVVRGIAKPQLEKTLRQLGKVDLVGKRFGVFKFVPKGWTGQPIDIALPRTEHSIGWTGAYRDFKIKSNPKLKIEDDLSRRDFTINAMAWDIFNQKLIDPFNGQRDAKKKIIRSVGIAHTRFKEDYSRMLRAIRFACQLNFEISPTAWQGLLTGMRKINHEISNQRVVPYEVIAQELVKAFRADAVKALDLLDRSGGLAALMPELLKMKKCPQPKNFHSEGDVWQHTVLALQHLTDKKFQKEFSAGLSDEVIWAVLFHDLGKPYTVTKTDRLRFNNHDNVSADKFKAVADRLRLSASGLDVDAVATVIRKHMLLAHATVAEMKQTTLEKYFFNENFPGQELLMTMFADLNATIWADGKPHFTDYTKLKNRIKKLQKKSKTAKKLPPPLVNGNDVMKTFKLKPGPEIGQLLAVAREQQLKGKIKTKKQGLTYLKKQL